MEEMELPSWLVINFLLPKHIDVSKSENFFLNSKYDQGKIKLCLFLALACRYVNKNHYRHAISLEEI